MSVAAVVSAIDYEQYRILCEKEERRHRRKFEQLRYQLKMFQETCEHKREWTHFEPDPSGNNDSYYECRKCGKQW